METNKTFLSQSMKGGIVAFVFSTLFVLLLALVAQLMTLSGDNLPIINQVLKGIAILIATLICVKENKWLPKAMFIGVIFVVLNLILFVVLGGEFNWIQVLLDLAISEVIAIVAALLKSRRSN